MKKIAITFVTIILTFSTGFTQSLVNKDASIYITNGSTLTVVSDFQNMEGGVINNNGELNIKANWINNGTGGVLTPGSTGSTSFNGNVIQTISGSNSTVFNNLNIEQNVNLLANVSVGNSLTISSGKVNLLDSDLSYEGVTGIGSNSNYYCIAEGLGKLIMSVGNGATSIFPVGTYFSYTPISIENNIAPDNFSVNVINDVLSNGSSGTSIPEIDDCVELTWNVEPSNTGTANYNVETQWNVSDEGAGFNRNKSAIGFNSGGSWIGNPASVAFGTNPYSQSLNNITSSGSFAVGDTESPMAIILDLNIDVTALLEGPFNGSEMLPSLNVGGIIPLNQPYNTSPWNYVGSENLAAIPNANVVDWVLVELRDAPDAASALPGTVIERQAAFVLKNGNIVGLDGTSTLAYVSTSITNNLFVVIYHRNHLAVMSANALTQIAGVYTYNFTTGANQAYGNGADGQKEIATGIWGMFGGDANADGNIETADKTIWGTMAGTKGYNNSDFDMSTQINNEDKNDIWIGNVGAASQVPE
jgi:hypothetical protein